MQIKSEDTIFLSFSYLSSFCFSLIIHKHQHSQMAGNNTTLIIVLVAGILVIATILLFISCWYIRKRRRENKSQISFTSGETETAQLIPPRSQKETERRVPTDDRSIVLTCRFYIRTTGDYTISSQLPQLGSDNTKHWFLLNSVGRNTASLNNVTPSLLTMQPKSDRLNQWNDEQSAVAYIKTLSNLFNRLFHPYVEPMNKIDVLYAQKLIIKITTFQREGSLKDLIEKVVPTIAYTGKYSNKNPGLSLERVRMYSAQILEGLLFLQSKSIPSLVDLHSGNIMVIGACLQIGSYEYQFLEQRSRIYSAVRRATASVTLANGMTRAQACEVYCFGALVFEMLVGYELGENIRDIKPEDWLACARDPNAHQMLMRLFDKSQPVLTLSQIQDLPYFSNKPVQLKELKNFKPMPGDYSNDVRVLLEQWTDTMKKKRVSSMRMSNLDRRTSTVTTKPPPSTPTPTSVIDLKYTPIVSSTPKASSNPPSSPPPPAPAPTTTSKPPPPPSTPTVSQVSAAPPPPPPPPPAAAAPPPVPSGGASDDRGALLENIRLGTKLRKAVTNDRSAPKFK